MTTAAAVGVRTSPGSEPLPFSSQVASESYPPQLLAPSGLTSTTPAPAPVPSAHIQTLPRSLNGVEVTSKEIDDLFDL